MNGIIVGVLVVAVIGLVGWLAYTQGFIASEKADGGGFNLRIGCTY